VVLVADDEAYGRAHGLALEDAREQLHLVVFMPGRGDGRLAWPAAVELLLHLHGINFHPGGEPVDDTTYGGPVRLAKCGERQYVAKCVAHALPICV
jgi:hypothetical protein